MYENIRNMKPLRDDILIVRKPKNAVENGENSFSHIILGNEDEKEDDPTQYFVVISVGSMVKSITPGDIVCVPWTRVTLPQMALLEEKLVRFGITQETEVLGIIE